MREGKAPVNMLALAIAIAANTHMYQTDKGGNPYILHPIKVMHYVKSDDEELKIMAILHDVVEDTQHLPIDLQITLDDLRAHGFSERVIAGVDALTKRPREKKEDNLKRILINRDACIVKLADLRHNSDIRRLKGLTEKDFARMQWYHYSYTTIKTTMTQMGW